VTINFKQNELKLYFPILLRLKLCKYHEGFGGYTPNQTALSLNSSMGTRGKSKDISLHLASRSDELANEKV
jgi:hypothetical protein